MIEIVSGIPENFNCRTNIRECEDQNWFKVQAICFCVPAGYAYSRFKTAGLEDRGTVTLPKLSERYEGRYLFISSL
jgi:hypothetical protein